MTSTLPVSVQVEELLHGLSDHDRELVYWFVGWLRLLGRDRRRAYKSYLMFNDEQPTDEDIARWENDGGRG